jgi:hypothetical protein
VSRFRKYIGEVVGEALALIIGWLVCISVLAGAFSLGRWAAPHLGWDGSPEIFGLLSALTFLWIYEHQNFERNFDGLRELIVHAKTD